MSDFRRAGRLLLDTLVCPGALVRGLDGGAPLVATTVLLGALGIATQLAQSFLVAPVLRLDPLAQDAPGGPEAALRGYWIVRAVACVAAPLALLVRSAALASVLQASGVLLGAAAAWRPLFGLALHLELVFALESACLTVLLWLDDPASLEALRAVSLHAGLDLFWTPASAGGRALLASANVFTAWWVVLLGFGLARLLRLRTVLASSVALTLWAGLVTLRTLLQPR
jgi:hypothetical protein